MPKMVSKNDYHDKAIQYIEQVFATAWFWGWTYEKNRNRNSTYESYQKRIITICNWLQKHYISRKIAENFELPRYKRKPEKEIRKLILPFYWNAEMIEDYLYGDHAEMNKKRQKKGLSEINSLVERYHENEITGEYIHSMIHALRAFKKFYQAAAQIRHPLVINGESETVRSQVRTGNLDELFDSLEEMDVLKCRMTAHGRKATFSEAELVIDWVGKSQKYDGIYNSLVQDVLRTQLATGGRIQSTLKLKRSSIILYTPSNVARDKSDKNTYHTAPFTLPLLDLLGKKGNAAAYGQVTFYDKGAIVRSVFITEYFYTMWKTRLATMKENEHLFPFYKMKRDKHNKIQYDSFNHPVKDRLMSVEEAMRIVAELTAEASVKANLTEKVEVVYYQYYVNGKHKGDYYLYELKNMFHQEDVDEAEDVDTLIKERGKKWEKRRKMFRQIEQDGFYKEETFEIRRKVKEIKMSVNSHSMRKCYLGEVLRSSEKLTRVQLKEMVKLHKDIQRGISKKTMNRRVNALLLTVNKDTFKANKRRLEEVRKAEKKLGRVLTDQEKEAKNLHLLGFRDFTHYELRKMICSLSGGHTRLSTLVEFYVEEDPETIKRDREEKKHVRRIRSQQKIASLQEAHRNLIIVE